mmetsp:Transcript_22907/g.66653  ORF Transcript_22907/g.66653 Transcript_22907/m.66653 type:complete len:233 (-) Transcript_22907:1839-2537(-)
MVGAVSRTRPSTSLQSAARSGPRAATAARSAAKAHCVESDAVQRGLRLHSFRVGKVKRKSRQRTVTRSWARGVASMADASRWRISARSPRQPWIMGRDVGRASWVKPRIRSAVTWARCGKSSSLGWSCTRFSRVSKKALHVVLSLARDSSRCLRASTTGRSRGVMDSTRCFMRSRTRGVLFSNRMVTMNFSISGDAVSLARMSACWMSSKTIVRASQRKSTMSLLEFRRSSS